MKSNSGRQANQNQTVLLDLPVVPVQPVGRNPQAHSQRLGRFPDWGGKESATWAATAAVMLCKPIDDEDWARLRQDGEFMERLRGWLADRERRRTRSKNVERADYEEGSV